MLARDPTPCTDQPKLLSPPQAHSVLAPSASVRVRFRHHSLCVRESLDGHFFSIASAPKSGQIADMSECLLCASTGLVQCSKKGGPIRSMLILSGTSPRSCVSLD